LIHLILNALVVISWVIFLKIVGLERNILGQGNIMTQLLRMMNQKKIRKVLMGKRKEYYLFSSLSSSISMGPKIWLVDSGASKHMTWYKEILSYIETKSFAEQVKLRDEKCYKIEGVGSISFKLESRARVHVDEVLYVPRLKKNILSVATLEYKGYWVILKDRKALLWDKGSHVSIAKPIGTCSGGLYVVSGQSVQALAHDATSSNKLWHRRLGHLHYKDLLDLQNMVCGMQSISLIKN